MYDLPDWLEEKIIPEPNSGCWLWIGMETRGYGRVHLPTKTNKKGYCPAHRFIYEFYNGPVSDDLEIDHLCRNPFCVNPEHLEPVTPKINILRGNARAAINARKLVCMNGHPFVRNKTQRYCPTCKANYNRIYQQSKTRNR